ncbi:polyamine aminopropyltransferase [Commensalibacter oyaizuii]|uniref:Polyamine aminopropyltransferase n=1 Tax=Commensalibacter oyaizuii TaxID=3043873 RepID=A0ABT6Q1G2_9PROT|nr:polyamine aminopropyltransferase [Commensalibacter sp. TBRC 16381]MDI2090947.1 polyamine aminopropyltransferase [Commensalibacter sp. TBRC 16381]
MSKNWVNETLYDAWQQRFRVDKELVHKKSEYQDIQIIENEFYGRVLLLDGVTQISEKDEFVYQEMLTHVPLFIHGHAKRVLIIGAGDGGVLRRVLQHPEVEKATMVEIDGEVVALAKQFMPDISGACWDDPRAELIIGDGIQYVVDAPSESFDVIIVDSTDPIGVGEVLFTDEFYKNSARILTKNGLIVNQCGVPFMQADELRETSLRRSKFFDYVSAYVAAVPTYVGGFMTLGIAGKGQNKIYQTVEVIKERAVKANLLNKTRYWSPEVQLAAFALPPYISEQLPENK